MPLRFERIPGGTELYDSLPSFSADVVWLIAMYTFPLVPRLFQEQLLAKTKAIRSQLEGRSPFNGHLYSIGYYDLYHHWEIRYQLMGFRTSRLVAAKFQDMSVAPWVERHHEAGRCRCPQWLFDWFVSECPGGVPRNLKFAPPPAFLL